MRLRKRVGLSDGGVFLVARGFFPMRSSVFVLGDCSNLIRAGEWSGGQEAGFCDGATAPRSESAGHLLHSSFNPTLAVADDS